MKCKICGSEQLTKAGTVHTGSMFDHGTIEKQRWRCKNCGKYTVGNL